jgi:hypothetical protein
MDIELPKFTLLPVALEPTAEEPLMAADSTQQTPEPLFDHLSVGEPIPILLSREWASGDHDLANFIEAESQTHSYWLVYLACTMTPGPASQIESANFTCYLGHNSGDTEALPIAVSMTPERVRDIEHLKRTTSLKLTADLKLVTPGVEVGRTAEGDVVSDVIVAYNLQRPEPFWALKRSDRLPLEGSFRFALVVRARRGQLATLRLGLGGTVRERRFGLFPYRVPLPQQLAEPMSLP